MPKVNVALPTRTVLQMVKLALGQGEEEVASLMVLSRAFLLRVPSEALPMEWEGAHSCISVDSEKVALKLARRKNSRNSVTLTRRCSCSSGPPLLCAFHWLVKLKEVRDGRTRLFTIGKTTFATAI